MTDHRKGIPDFDDPRSAEDLALAQALRGVVLPDGLEARLLAAMPAEDLASAKDPSETLKGSSERWSRRAWLASAASLAGLAVVGRYLYTHRRIGEVEVRRGVMAALRSAEWTVPWSAMAESPGVALPKSLRMPRGWQYVDTVWNDKTVAFDLTLPGGPPAVLFTVGAPRGLADFPASPPAVPKGASGDWRLAMWQGKGVLYVLASQGTDRQFQSLFLNAGTPPLV